MYGRDPIAAGFTDEPKEASWLGGGFFEAFEVLRARFALYGGVAKTLMPGEARIVAATAAAAILSSSDGGTLVAYLFASTSTTESLRDKDGAPGCAILVVSGHASGAVVG